jgi:hypothetical protein
MHKLLSLLVGTMFIASAYAASEDDWQNVSKTFKYKSNNLSCEITTSGAIRQLTADGALIIKNSYLHGKYVIIKGEKHDRRFFQKFEKEHPVKSKKTGENSYIFKKTGILSNKKHTSGASYTEKISLSPHEMKIEFEIKLLVPLASKSSIFCSINNLPLETFISKGFRLTHTKGKSELMVFQQNYSKATGLHTTGVKDIMISLEKGVFKITADKGADLSISDTRSYKGKSFRVDIKKAIPWKSKAVEFSAGKTFKWSFKLAYEKFK